MRTVFMVAEKPMLAESIANILSDKRATKRKGWNGACNVHEYSGDFFGEHVRFKVSSTCGHVMGVDFPGKYNNWDRVDPLELFGCPIEQKEATAKLKMPQFLSSEAKGADFLVLWLDCDKEGENICFEVVDVVKPVMNRPNSGSFMDNVYRAHFSAITEKDLKQAMRQLGRPNKNEALSVDARQELDLRVGCAFTRFQTKHFQGKYGDLDSSCISFGPCQTPTLGFCVARHDQIQQFKPEPYWVLQTLFESATRKTATGDRVEIKPEWQRGRIFDRDIAQIFLDRIKAASSCHVTDITKKESQKGGPSALNTVELMRVASSALGMGPQHAMSIAEQLYTQGYISYPRTETTQYPSNFDLKGTMHQLQGMSRWRDVIRRTLASHGVHRPKGGDDKGDHPPITPMRADAEGRLSGEHARIYEYICQHFIASLMPPCRYYTTTIKLLCGEEELSISGKTVIDPGFTEVLPWQSVEDDVQLPELKKGERLEMKDAKLVERMTTPPGYLTESELITLMEKHGIGTDASIPVHINNIGQRNYVTVESGRRLVPTKLGVALVHGYLKIDPQLVLPNMRSEVETQLTLIAKGEADYIRVKDHVLENFRQKFVYYVQSITLVADLFEVSFTSLAESGKPFSRCGKCHRFLKLIESRPQRLHCAICQDSYSLPTARDGTLRLYAEKKCPLDEFELVYWQGPGGLLSRSYPLCPYCYNNPPFAEMRKGYSGCTECLHPACIHGYASLGVVNCPRNDCVNGVLLLDTQSAPKWRLSCNKCASVVGFCNGAVKAKVSTRKECPDCGAKLITVEYKEKSPLPDGATTHTGCLFCDETLIPEVNLSHVNRVGDPNATFGVQRGRGRGRGGRGGARGGGGRGGGTTRGAPRRGGRP